MPGVAIDQQLPDLVFGYICPAPEDPETSMLRVADPLDLDAYRPTESQMRTARQAAEDMGFVVTAESSLGLAVAGSPDLFRRLTGGQLQAVEVYMPVEQGGAGFVTHIDVIGDGQPSALGVGEAQTSYELGSVFLERPAMPKQVTYEYPSVEKYHLTLEDLPRILHATVVHDRGNRGQGVNVAMVDSGCFPHPYFDHVSASIERVSAIPGVDPCGDPIGHGTGVAANFFALAPDATLHSFRASDDRGNLVALLAAFMQAKATPDICAITNSWGYDLPVRPLTQLPLGRRPVVAEIVDAVRQDIAVVFAGGNDSFSVEPQVPGVISVGGVYCDPAGEFRVSDYTASYVSPWFAASEVPTVSGLVGLQPRAQYLMLPVAPGSVLDRTMALPDLLSEDPPDGTGKDDGWALFSGSSAAAPQVAGAIALLCSDHPKLPKGDISAALQRSANKVEVGRANALFGLRPPGVGAGAGLVDVAALLERADTEASA